MKDHYKILGITPSATQQEVKKVYRTRAMQYHPDKNPDNHFAHERFIEIQEAYSILSDSRLRERYDSERWLNGMGRRTDYSQAVTPEWLLDMCRKLNESLEKMDIHRISHHALQQYIMLILSGAHLGVLRQHKDEDRNTAIITSLLKSMERLELKYLYEVSAALKEIVPAAPEALQAIDDNLSAREREERQRRLFPYIILAVTLALCVFMYYYGK